MFYNNNDIFLEAKYLMLNKIKRKEILEAESFIVK